MVRRQDPWTVFTHMPHVHTYTEEVERWRKICSLSQADYLMRNVDYLMRNIDNLIRMLDVHYLAFAPLGQVAAMPCGPPRNNTAGNKAFCFVGSRCQHISFDKELHLCVDGHTCGIL